MKKPRQIQIGEAIHAALTRKGLSQQELADEAGYGKSYISEIISGKKNLTLQTIETLESALHLPLIKVLTNE